MNPYQARCDELTKEIRRLADLRNAQAPGSRHHVEFQDQITHLTDMLRVWEQAGPHLVTLDRRITVAHRDLTAAIRDAEDSASGWSGAAGAAGAAGGLAVGASLLWTLPPWLLVAGGALLLAAVGMLYLSMRARRAADERVMACRRVVAGLEAERAALLPEGQR